MIAKLTGKDNLWMRLIRAAVLVVAAVVLVMSCSTTAFATEDSNEKEFSFYKISSAAAMYYDHTHNAKSEDSFTTSVSMETAGNFVGFIDEDYGDGFIGSTVSFLSSSQQSRGYSSFAEDPLREYVEYGHALSALGLDSTANETFDFGAIIRIFGGIVLYVAYSCALVADVFFSAAITILQTFNPFAWFVDGVKSVGGWFFQLFSDTPTGAPDPNQGLYSFAGFDGLRTFISGWYDGLFELGMTVTALLFFVTLGITLMAWNSQRDKMKTVFRTFFTRILFICIGVPLLGGLYTATLDMAAENTSLKSGYPAANQVLMSTLLDFESWAADGDLALPDGNKIAVTLKGDLAGNVNAGKSTPTRELARSINNHYSPAGVWNYDSSDFDWGVGLWGPRPLSVSISGAYDVIGRYMGNAFYHASDYETAYKKSFARSNSGSSDYNDTEKKAFYNTVEKYTGDYDTYKDNDAYLAATEASEDDSVFAPYMNDASAGSYGFETTGDASDYQKGRTLVYTGTGNGGLSSMSMYNYLTTSFKDSSVVTYSAKKATSGMVVEAHHSVNVIGDGAMSVLYFANMISMFWAIAIIGFCYCFGMIINMLGRGIKMVSSVPFAMLGNMRAMSKVCTIVAMMVIEILGTFFVYSLVVELLISLQGLIETPLNEVLSSNVTSTLLAGVPGISLMPVAAASLVGTLISTVFYFIFGLKAVKWRKSIIKAIDEGVANVIDRIFTPDPSGGAMSNAGGAGAKMVSKPSIGERVKDAGRAAGGAVMAGAGMAAGQMLATKAGDKLGFTAGSVDEDGKDGMAENAGGADQEDIVDGGQIQGAERQGLPGSDGPDGTRNALPAPPSDGDEHAGQAIMAADVESLGDVRSDEVNGVQAGESARPGEVEHETTNVAVSDDDVAQVDASSADAKQAAVDTELARAAGQTTAMEDERDDELKSKERKAAAKDAVKGVAKTAEGGAKVAAGYATGNAELMAEGAQDAAKGAAKTAKAGQRAADAGTKVDAARQQKTEQKKALSQGGQSGARPAGQSGQAKPAKTGGPSRAASSAKQDTRVSSTVNAVGGASTVLNKGGDMRVNAPQKGAQAPKQSPKLTAQLDKLGRQQAALKQAEKQVLATGKATLPNGKVVRNVADVRQMQRNLAQKSKAIQSGVEHASTVASLGAAKKLTDKKKKDDDGSFF